MSTMKEVAGEYLKTQELCTRMWKETSELLVNYGTVHKDRGVRILLPLAVGAVVLYKILPTFPLRTLPRRTLDFMDERRLIFDLGPYDGSGIVSLHSKLDTENASWSDIFIRGATRFLRFTKNVGYVCVLPEDPQYRFGLNPRVFQDPFNKNRSVLVNNLGVADVGTLSTYDSILQQVRQALP